MSVCLSVCLSVSVVCCQVKVSASDWVSRTEYGVSECVREAWIKRRPWPTRHYGAK
jgi:hypothetical protein